MEENPPPTFGGHLKSLRRQQHLTQMELSRRTGIGQSYISALERGVVVNPSRATMVRLASALSAAELAAYSWLPTVDAAPGHDPNLTELLRCWRELAPLEQSFLLWIVRTLANREATGRCEDSISHLGESYATLGTNPIAARDPGSLDRV